MLYCLVLCKIILCCLPPPHRLMLLNSVSEMEYNFFSLGITVFNNYVDDIKYTQISLILLCIVSEPFFKFLLAIYCTELLKEECNYYLLINYWFYFAAVFCSWCICLLSEVPWKPTSLLMMCFTSILLFKVSIEFIPVLCFKKSVSFHQL